jgi:hypothetical protein
VRSRSRKPCYHQLLVPHGSSRWVSKRGAVVCGRFEYSRQDPKEHELNTGLKFKISVTMEEFNLDALASALMHLMPIHTYTPPSNPRPSTPAF